MDRRQGGAGVLTQQGKDSKVLGEVQELARTVNGFIKDYPKRVYVKKGLSYRRMALAFIIYLGALVYNLKFFDAHNLFSHEECVEIARIVFKTAPDYAQLGRYVYMGFMLLLSLLSLASSFMIVMVLCLFLSIFRFKWVNSVFEALAHCGGLSCFHVLLFEIPTLYPVSN